MTPAEHYAEAGRPDYPPVGFPVRKEYHVERRWRLGRAGNRTRLGRQRGHLPTNPAQDEKKVTSTISTTSTLLDLLVLAALGGNAALTIYYGRRADVSRTDLRELNRRFRPTRCANACWYWCPAGCACRACHEEVT